MPRGILTVLTPAPDRRLASAADVHTELGLSGEPSDNDLNPRILQASDAIATACGGRVFGRESLREVFRVSSPAAALILARAPLVAIASLSVGDTLLTEGTDFEVEVEAGIIHRLAGDCRSSWCASTVTVAQKGEISLRCCEGVYLVFGAERRAPIDASHALQHCTEIYIIYYYLFIINIYLLLKI